MTRLYSKNPDAKQATSPSAARRPARNIAQQSALADLKSRLGNRGTQQLLASVQRKCACLGKCEPCRDKDDNDETLQRKSNSEVPSASAIARAREIASRPGVPLPHWLRAEMGARFGHDFTNVRVHDDAAADAAARALHAEAFTAGSAIGFAAGRYQPETDDGRGLLAHELAHVVQQRSGRRPVGSLDGGHNDPLEREAEHQAARALANSLPAAQSRVPLSSSASVSSLQRKSAAADDQNLLRHKGKWTAIDSPSVLSLWAREAAIEMLWFGSTVRAIQEDPSNADCLVDKVRLKLHQALYSPDKFSGSPAARRDAVEALDMQWENGQLREPILEKLLEKYRRQRMQALAHTPEGSDLVTAPEDYVRIRCSPYLGKFFNGADTMEKRYTRGNREVVDIKGDWGLATRRSPDPTADIWYILKRDPNWIYLTGGGYLPFDWYVGRFASETADNTRFAAELFPLVLKIGGFALGFSSRLSMIIASEIVTALGEQGTRSARGQKMESAFEVATGVGLGIFVGAVTNRMFGDSGRTLRGQLDDAAEHAAAKGRTELARGEAPLIERGFAAGGSRAVTDPDLISKGYRLQVEVVSEGQTHIWRQHRNGWWCRFSNGPVCVAKVSDAVTAAANTARAAQRGLAHVPTYAPVAAIADRGREALLAAPAVYRGYLDNLLTRIRRLEEAMSEAVRHGTPKPEVDSLFRPAFEKLRHEADVVHARFVYNDTRKQLPALQAIDEAGGGGVKHIVDEPELYDFWAKVERRAAGTQYHDVIKQRILSELPEGTVFTEDTIKAFLRREGIDPKKVIVKKKRGIDLYVFDRRRNLLTPVDITYVAGHPKHVDKLHRDLNKLETGLKGEPLSVTEAFEIEYAGMSFDEATTSIINELRPYAR